MCRILTKTLRLVSCQEISYFFGMYSMLTELVLSGRVAIVQIFEIHARRLHGTLA